MNQISRLSVPGCGFDQQRVWKVKVWTTKRSAAQIASAWLARKFRQLWLGGLEWWRRR